MKVLDNFDNHFRRGGTFITNFQNSDAGLYQTLCSEYRNRYGGQMEIRSQALDIEGNEMKSMSSLHFKEMHDPEFDPYDMILEFFNRRQKEQRCT